MHVSVVMALFYTSLCVLPGGPDHGERAAGDPDQLGHPVPVPESAEAAQRLQCPPAVPATAAAGPALTAPDPARTGPGCRYVYTNMEPRTHTHIQTQLAQAQAAGMSTLIWRHAHTHTYRPSSHRQVHLHTCTHASTPQLQIQLAQTQASGPSTHTQACTHAHALTNTRIYIYPQISQLRQSLQKAQGRLHKSYIYPYILELVLVAWPQIINQSLHII